MFYEFFRVFATLSGYPFLWLYFKHKIYYENESVSKKVRGKGALVISNHFSFKDYIVNMFIFFPRKLYVVASEYSFHNALIRFGMKFWGGIEANRITKSPRFMVQSIREIKKGHMVQIFPEGHNTDDGTIHDFYPSYILIALRAGTSIIPVVTDGNYGWFKRVHVLIGESIDLSQYASSPKPDKEEIGRLNDMVRQKVLELREELDLRIRKDKAKRKKT